MSDQLQDYVTEDIHKK